MFSMSLIDAHGDEFPTEWIPWIETADLRGSFQPLDDYLLPGYFQYI